MVITEGERELFIGAKVTIDEGSTYWDENDRYNPRGIVGKVIRIVAEDDEVWYGVLWANGWENSYTNGDLKVLGEVVHE